MAVQLSLFDLAGPPVVPDPWEGGRVVVVRGARAAEAVLFERLEALADEARRDPRLLAQPVRVVVPSKSLRSHLVAALARAAGRARIGVVVQTLYGAAAEILERAGETAPGGRLLFGWAAAELARKQRDLAPSLAAFEHGYRTVAASVRDLLDAGLEPSHAAAAAEVLASDGPGSGASRAELIRARALVDIAVGVEEILRAWGPEGEQAGHAALWKRAARRLRDHPEGPEGALPSRALFIHGFAEATGVATDLLEGLLGRPHAWLLLDRPPAPEGSGSETAFTERLVGRLRHRGVTAAEPALPVPRPRLAFFEAPGAEAEAREVARRLRVLLDHGARPEGIGIVARDLLPYRSPLARHLGRLGVPFSSPGTRGGLLAAGRLQRAVLDLLARGVETPAERWLDAAASPSSGPRVDLRLAFASLGAGRLAGVAALPLAEILRDRGSFALPIRQGLRRAAESAPGEPGDGGEEEPEDDRRLGEHGGRRRIQGFHLRRAVAAARRVAERFAAWPERAPLADHLRRLGGLLAGDLGWQPEAAAAAPLFAALVELERELPASLPLAREDLAPLLEEALAGVGAALLGGRGGGVQLLSVMESRGRTFEHLFVAGFNRGAFPRTIREDPLLPDSLRRLLRQVLPDIPVKLAGFDEERHLFAQLLSAGPAITLSWQRSDEEGRPVPRSPLLARLELPAAVAVAPALPARDRSPKTAAEQALVAALSRSRPALAEVLPVALKESAAAGAVGWDPGAVAAARLAVLAEIDPDRRTAAGWAARRSLGPYFGFLGPWRPADLADPRGRALSITWLERLAGCPWQLFLGRLLELEPTPDPLAALPGADRLFLGNLVHRGLEAIAQRALPGEEGAEPGELAALPDIAVRWPEAAEVGRLLEEAAARLLADDGIFLPGLARAVARRARPFLDIAREVDWPRGERAVVAVEAQGEIEVLDAGGAPRRLRFRADRVDRAAAGWWWTDYKTGRPLSLGRGEDTRRKHLLRAVAAGSHLQAAAYAAAGAESRGRYLYLRPDLEGAARDLGVDGDDREMAAAFAATAAAALAAWDAGSFFPRLVEPAGDKEPPRCKLCPVAEACLRGDSGHRLRLVDWAERWSEGPGEPGGAAERALWSVWRLGMAAAAREEKNGGEDP